MQHVFCDVVGGVCCTDYEAFEPGVMRRISEGCGVEGDAGEEVAVGEMREGGGVASWTCCEDEVLAENSCLLWFVGRQSRHSYESLGLQLCYSHRYFAFPCVSDIFEL